MKGGEVARIQGTGAHLPCVFIRIRAKGGWKAEPGVNCLPGACWGGPVRPLPLAKGDGARAKRGGRSPAEEEGAGGAQPQNGGRGRGCSWVEGTGGATLPLAHCPACTSAPQGGRRARRGGGTLFPL